MYRPEIAYQKRTWNSREQNHLPRYPLPDWPTAWPTVEGAGFCPHYPRSTPSQRLQRHPTVEGDFVFGNPGRINAHTQKQSAERTAPSSSAQRFALAAGGRLFRRRCANRSALRTDWGKIATGAQKGRFCAPTEKNCIRCAECASLRTDCCYNKLGLRLWGGNGAVNCDYRDSESRRG